MAVNSRLTGLLVAAGEQEEFRLVFASHLTLVSTQAYGRRLGVIPMPKNFRFWHT